MAHASHTLPQVSERSLHEEVLAALDARGSDVAIVDGVTGRTLSGRDVAGTVRRAAAGLQQRGHGPGDVVCLAAPNSPEWLIAALAALATGATVTTTNPMGPPALLAKQLSSSGARTCVTVPPLLDWAHTAADGLDVELIVMGDAADSRGHPTLGDLTTAGAELKGVPVDPAATAFLLSSSGTSGLAKLVMLSHRALVATRHAVRAAIGLGPGDRTLMALPVFHSGGLSVSLASLCNGARLVLQPGFELQRFCQAVADHGATFTVIVPPIVQALARHPDVGRYDLSSLRLVMSTAAPLGAALETELGARLGCAVGQGYAMTEGIPFAISRSDLPGYRPGSVGRAVPGTELRVVDPDTGADVPPGDPGELWVRGPQLMTGYAGNPEATAATLTTDGWLRTGDLCRVDPDGVVTVEDRLKELIKVNGLQVPPAELEGILHSHPDVKDCAVVPRPHERSGEVPVAYVVATPGTDLGAVASYVAERVLPHRRLADVIAVDEIPRNPTGKLLRRVLVERERAAHASA